MAQNNTNLSNLVENKALKNVQLQTLEKINDVKIPTINIIPPIVGVPCLFLCQEGPIYKIVWPYFILCKNGISHFPNNAVKENDIRETTNVKNPFI